MRQNGDSAYRANKMAIEKIMRDVNSEKTMCKLVSTKNKLRDD